MDIRPEDRWKAVALILAVLAVLVLAVMRTMSAIRANRPVPAPAPTVPAPVAQNLQETPIDLKPIGYNGVNPFRMVVDPKILGESTANMAYEPSGYSTTPPGTKVGKPGFGSTRPMPGVLADGTYNPSGPVNSELAPMQPEIPLLAAKLEGVLSIRGVRSALLLEGETTRYLKMGDDLGAGFKVSKIGDFSIEISRGLEKRTVKVGDMTDGSGMESTEAPAAKAPATTAVPKTGG